MYKISRQINPISCVTNQVACANHYFCLLRFRRLRYFLRATCFFLAISVPTYYVSSRHNYSHAAYTEDNTISQRRQELHAHRQILTSAGQPPVIPHNELLANHRSNLTSVGPLSINEKNAITSRSGELKNHRQNLNSVGI